MEVDGIFEPREASMIMAVLVLNGSIKSMKEWMANRPEEFNRHKRDMNSGQLCGCLHERVQESRFSEKTKLVYSRGLRLCEAVG